MRFSPRTTVAAVATVAALSGGALAIGGAASADTGDGDVSARTVQVQDSTPAPGTAPDTGRDRDCPEDGRGGAGGSGAEDGASGAPDSAPATTDL